MAAIIAAHGEKGHRLAASDSMLSLNASYATYVADKAAVQQAEIEKTKRKSWPNSSPRMQDELSKKWHCR